jgi:hypothetical protein
LRNPQPGKIGGVSVLRGTRMPVSAIFETPVPIRPYLEGHAVSPLFSRALASRTWTANSGMARL